MPRRRRSGDRAARDDRADGVGDRGVRRHFQDKQTPTAHYEPPFLVYGAGTEIMVQVAELWEKPERTPEVLNRLAKALGEAVRERFPEAKTVAAKVDPLFKPERDGFWMDRKSG